MGAKIRQKDIGNHKCPNCGKDRLNQFRYRLKWCVECGHIKTGIKKRKEKEIKKCLVCGGPISVYPCEIKRKKFCSVKCRIQSYIGRKLTEKHKEKIGLKSLGHRLSLESRIKLSASNQGIKIEEWKDFSTNEQRQDRIRFVRRVRPLVLERDAYSCQMCGSRKHLQIDHIKEFSKFKDLRLSPENCRTLCQSCHYLITFGKIKPKNVKKWGVKL